jgi:hypothetical protein
MARHGEPSVIDADEVVVRLTEAESLIRAACRTLDDVARLGPPGITDRLNEVEGQADLGVTANHLSDFAAELKRESSASRGEARAASSRTLTSKPLAPSKSRRDVDAHVTRKTAEEKH